MYNVKRVDSDKFRRSLIQNFMDNKLESSINVAAEAFITPECDERLDAKA